MMKIKRRGCEYCLDAKPIIDNHVFKLYYNLSKKQIECDIPVAYTLMGAEAKYCLNCGRKLI